MSNDNIKKTPSKEIEAHPVSENRRGEKQLGKLSSLKIKT